MNGGEAARITDRILASRKYRPLVRGFVERTVAACLTQHGPKATEKKARSLLHQVWGAYYPTRPDFTKALARLEKGIAGGLDVRTALLPLLALHSSTRERVPELDGIYRHLFGVTGPPASVLDLGCGFNPLTLPWMGLPAGTLYEGVDIDAEQNAFLAGALPLVAPSGAAARVRNGDALAGAEEKADVILALKLLPLLERQKAGAALDFIRRCRDRCRCLVVSFPEAGLSGRKRRMGEFHVEALARTVETERWTTARLRFRSEYFFLIGKDPGAFPSRQGPEPSSSIPPSWDAP